MPEELQLTTPTTINETISAIRLTSITFDIEDTQVHIAYDEGVNEAGVFRTLRRDVLLTIPSDLIPTFQNVWENQTGATKFLQMRKACLRAIANLANRPGTVNENP